VEEIMKDKNKAQEIVKKAIQEKEEVESIVHKTQVVVQKLYKAIS
jgi:hypothetical protein